jgi:zinc transport system substrate-binding protein
MRHYLNIKLLVWGAFPSALLIATACGGNGVTPVASDARLTVVASIYPMAYFAERIGGERVDVITLVPPGVEAHSFVPTPGDLQTNARADVAVMNGLALELWMTRALDALGANAPGVVVEAAPDSETSDGSPDPHVWLDPLLAMEQAARILKEFVALDGAGADSYAANAAALIEELEALDAAYVSGLASCTHASFVTTHAAYGHLAARYGLNQVSITGISPEAEPSARDLAEVIEHVDELAIRFVLVEPSLSHRLAETVAAESDLSLLDIHQLGSVTQAEIDAHDDYFGLMRANLENLTTALECAA